MINTKAPANHFVARASLASSVFDLFLDKKVSELPLKAPDKPDDFPDWSTTTAIIDAHKTRWMTTSAVFIKLNPFRKMRNVTMHFITECYTSTT